MFVGRADIVWRPFLRAMAEEIDSLSSPSDRDLLLRGVGRRMATLVPLPAAASLDALEAEMNDVLGAIGWGSVRLSLQEAQRSLVFVHSGLPRIGGAGSPPGTWLAALLEGLYERWMSQQPGSDPDLTARRDQSNVAGDVTLRFGRG